ncbi:MAG TPA: DUF5691 domain-containing protein, partial [Fimbriimonadaceae bacterium]|nr:DUF5691 domain-containing protein [Fimbriimonadaceae bacterium]
MPPVTRAAWLELVGSAVAGTSKRGVGPDRESGLLAEAALLSAGLRAGYVVESGVVETVPEAPDDAKVASDKAARLLQRCLNLTPALVSVWLYLAAESKTTVPYDCLTAILDLGAKDNSKRGLVRPTIGPRGLWLSQLNPAWTYAAEAARPDQEVWDQGTESERLRLLVRLPKEKAIELAKSTYASE